MKIKEIRLVNFGCFGGAHAFSLPRLSALIGKNGTGKTTILNAIRFCLTGAEPDGDIISNGSSFSFGGVGQDYGQLKTYITPGYNDKIGYTESTTLTAYAPGATSYRWLCDGKPVEGGEDGTLVVAWTHGGVAQVPGFKVHTYQAVAVFEGLHGATRESAAVAAVDIKCRLLGTTFIIK